GGIEIRLRVPEEEDGRTVDPEERRLHGGDQSERDEQRGRTAVDRFSAAAGRLDHRDDPEGRHRARTIRCRGRSNHRKLAYDSSINTAKNSSMKRGDSRIERSMPTTVKSSRQSNCKGKWSR